MSTYHRKSEVAAAAAAHVAAAAAVPATAAPPAITVRPAAATGEIVATPWGAAVAVPGSFVATDASGARFVISASDLAANYA